jgi:DNA polymerase I-like protein with 3'-5' exonuclease and polymerase domains
MEEMLTEAEERNLTEFYKEFYIKPFLHSLRMEWDGLLVNVEERDKQLKEANSREKILQDWINKKVGYELNVMSHKQMVKFLYKEQQYPPVLAKKANKKGERITTTDKFAMDKLSARFPEHEVLKWIVELRNLRDYRSDILTQILDEENKIHTHYKLGGTDGARWSSTRSILGNGSNLQNIRRDSDARKLFLP